MIELKEKLLASRYIKQKKYWLAKLENINETRLFKSNDRNANSLFKSHELIISEDISNAVINLANHSDLSIYIILLTVVNFILYKYTGNNSITVLSGINKNIENEGINDLLYLKTELSSSEISFKELLGSVKDTVLEAFENQDYPLEKVLDALSKTSLNSYGLSSLTNVAFTYDKINNETEIESLGDKIVFSFKRIGNQLQGAIKFDSEIYNESYIKSLSNHFINITKCSVSDLNSLIQSYSCLTALEYQKYIIEINNTEIKYNQDKTLQDLFEDQVRKTPENIAVEYGENRLSYKELNRRSNELAICLSNKGISPDKVVAIKMDNSIEMIIGIMGILKSGGSYLPIDTKYPKERISYMLEDSNAEILLTDTDFVENYSLNIDVVHINKLEINDCSIKKVLHKSLPSNFAYIIYTSGSTGVPKGVMIEHHSIVNYIRWASDTYIKESLVSIPLYSSFAFDMSMTSIFTPLLTGNKILIYNAENNNVGELLSRIIKENLSDIIKVTPSHLKLIKEQPDILDILFDLNDEITLKRFIIGGESLDTNLAKEIHELFGGNIELYNEYGPTEATVGCMIYKYDLWKDSDTLVPIGNAISNAKVYILDSSLNPMPIGAEGELYVAGECLARGYINKEKQTKESFLFDTISNKGNFYKTGDLARFLPNGNIEYLGRIDDQVKIRGYRIELGEIERKLEDVENIDKAIVITHKDSNNDDYLCAYYLSNHNIEIADIKSYLKKTLPDYMIPQFYILIFEMPLNKNGKLDRKLLPLPDFFTNKKHIAPRNEIEKNLTQIWANTLNIPSQNISIDSVFFDIGGHSLNATILGAKIFKAFNTKLSVEDLFTFSSIIEQADVISKKEKTTDINIIPKEKKEYYPLSGAQKRVYFQQLKSPNDILFNVPVAVTIEGNIDVEKLKDVFIELIKRHENFRTSFITINYEVFQKVNDDIKIDFQIYDNKFSQEEINELIKPFNLQSHELFRVILIRVATNKIICVMDSHHIITDAVTQEIIINDLKKILLGRKLNPVKIQYKDYCEWQLLFKLSESYLIQKKYWTNHFQNNSPALYLNHDKVGIRGNLSEGKMIFDKLDDDIINQLNKIISEYKVTNYMYLLSAYYVLLHKYTGQNELVVGCPLSGRSVAELSEVAGFFINMLPLKQFISEDLSFLNLLADVKHTILKVIDNQDYQSEDLISNLKINRNETGVNPLFNLVFELIQTEDSSIKQIENENNLKIESFPIESTSSKFDMVFSVRQSDKNTNLFIEYSTELYKESTIRIFLNNYKKVLHQVVNNPDIDIKDIEIALSGNTINVNDFITDVNDFEF